MNTYLPFKTDFKKSLLTHRPKHISALKALICVLFFIYADGFSASASTLINPADTTADSTLLKKHLINQTFDAIYEQNTKISFAGNEYFNKDKTQLTADLAPNFILFSTPKSRFFFIFTSRVKIRLLDTRDAPVKSPSYMPGGMLFFRVNQDTYKPKFFSFAYSHHSNGVRGPSLNKDGTFNTDSGKFTTNFYTLTYYSGKRTDMKDLILNRYDNIGLEVHAGLFNLGLSQGLKDHYGFIRINGSRMYNLAKAYADPIEKNKKVYQNWQRLQFDFTYIADKYDDYSSFNMKKRLNVSLKYYYQFPFMGDTALMFGGGYRGQDDYNQSFQDSYGYVTVGIAAGLNFNFHRHSAS